jgi:hypothetical protein
MNTKQKHKLDEDIKDQMEDAGWICNRRGWWHPPSCLAAWPFDEAKAMFLRRHTTAHQRREAAYGDADGSTIGGKP